MLGGGGGRNNHVLFGGEIGNLVGMLLFREGGVLGAGGRGKEGE